MNADDVRRAAGMPKRHPALAVQCPHCRAPVGEPCFGPASKRRLPAPHPSRLSVGPDAEVIPYPPPPAS